MSALLEVIVTSVEEALEAQAGGADRLELLSAPEHAGLTPSLALVEGVLRAVSIPVRVMLRHHPSMFIRSASDTARLQASAAQFGRLPIDGLVSGFIRNGAVDEQVMRAIFEAAPEKPFTFHRAFDALDDQACGLDVLKQFPQVDRLLTSAGAGEWKRRVASFFELQRAAAPEIRIILAAGSDAFELESLRSLQQIAEVHVGRAARDPQTLLGAVSRARIAALKRALNMAT